jgi:hypothetical protein
MSSQYRALEHAIDSTFVSENEIDGILYFSVNQFVTSALHSECEFMQVPPLVGGCCC